MPEFMHHDWKVTFDFDKPVKKYYERKCKHYEKDNGFGFFELSALFVHLVRGISLLVSLLSSILFQGSTITEYFSTFGAVIVKCFCSPGFSKTTLFWFVLSK